MKLRILRWREHPRLSGWALNHKGPYKAEAKGDFRQTHTEEKVTCKTKQREI